MPSQYKATILFYRVLVSVILYSFYGEATLSPSPAPHSQHHSHPLIPTPPPYTRQSSNPLYSPPSLPSSPYNQITPPPHSQHHSHPLIPTTPSPNQHHSHPLIPSPDIIEPPNSLLPPTRLPSPYPYPGHHHDTPPPTNGGIGVITPSTSPQTDHPHHHHHHHHHHNKHHSSSPSSAAPLPSPYLFPPSNLPPLAPDTSPLIPHHNSRTHPLIAAPSNHPIKFTPWPPRPTPPPRRYGPWDALSPYN